MLQEANLGDKFTGHSTRSVASTATAMAGSENEANNYLTTDTQYHSKNELA